MSRGATLSIMGLYNNDSSIFDLMVYPEGFTADDKELVNKTILVECAELEVLYPNPAVMKSVINLWSRKELPYWQRIYDAAQLEYNPIENYRRNETEEISDGHTEQHSGSDVQTDGGSDSLAGTGTVTDAASGSDTLAKTGTITKAASGSDTASGASQSTTAEGGSDRAEHKITGYDSNTLVPNTEDDNYYGKTTSAGTQGQTTNNYGRTDTETDNTLDTTTYGKHDTQTRNTLDTTTYGKTQTMQHGEKIQHTGSHDRSVLAYGNIGVTTSQQMLTQEIELAKIINVIPVIVESFKDRFCLMVY